MPLFNIKGPSLAASLTRCPSVWAWTDHLRPRPFTGLSKAGHDVADYGLRGVCFPMTLTTVLAQVFPSR